MKTTTTGNEKAKTRLNTPATPRLRNSPAILGENIVTFWMDRHSGEFRHFRVQSPMQVACLAHSLEFVEKPLKAFKPISFRLLNLALSLRDIVYLTSNLGEVGVPPAVPRKNLMDKISKQCKPWICVPLWHDLRYPCLTEHR